MFRKLRSELLKQNRVARYLAYALGEIILVVIGILFAMQINNWNNGRNYEAETNQILRIVAEDLINDTAEVGAAIRNYKKRQEVYFAVLRQEATDSHYKTNPLFGLLISTVVPITLEKRGYNQLISRRESNALSNDKLVTQLIHNLGMLTDNIEKNMARLSDDVFSNINYWKNNYSWFWKLSTRQMPQDWLDYVVNSDDYKSRVAFHGELVYKNHLIFLYSFLNSAEGFLSQINERLKIKEVK